MKKNTFLYIVIAVLVIALAGLGALNVRSLDKLASLQTKVNKLQKSVQEVSDSAAELSSKADQHLLLLLLPKTKEDIRISFQMEHQLIVTLLDLVRCNRLRPIVGYRC